MKKKNQLDSKSIAPARDNNNIVFFYGFKFRG